MNDSKEKKFTLLALLIITFITTFFSIGTFHFPTLNVSVSIKYIIILFFLFFCLILSNYDLKIKYDYLSILLLIQMLFYLLRLTISNSNEFSLSIFSYIFSFFGYIWGINSEISLKNLLYFLKGFFYILVFQTIVTVYETSKLGLPLYMFKSNIIIPIGASNYITTFLVLIFPFLYKLINSKFEKNIVISLTLITVFMTRSNSGMIILITMLLMLIVTEKENKYLKLLFVISSFILVLFIGTQFIPGYFDRFTNTISSIFGSEQLMKQDAFNGRSSIFKISFQIFGDNLFIGKGFNYRILIPNQLMTHNWVLESLVTGGIVAFIIKIFILLSLLKKVKSLRMKYIKLALLISLFFTHVQGLVEPSFGSPIFELFFWMIFGFSISCSYNFHDVQMKGTQNEN